jgi:predicted O-methyltransferase YrrM
MNATSRRLLQEGSAVARSDGTVHTIFPTSVSHDVGHALRRWIERERPTKTLEIGLGYGISTLFICDGLHAVGIDHARHLAVDPNQSTRFANCGLQFIEEAGFAELVEFHAQPSELALPRFLAERRTFDLAFVDGNHRFDGVFVDLAYLNRLVRRGGMVLLDDYQLPAVKKAVSFCTTNLGWTLEETSRQDDLHHWAALRRPIERDTRPYDSYADF